MSDVFESWMMALFSRWAGELTHQEVARALKSLSRDYVQNRGKSMGNVLTGQGKRAAFALYYGIRHFVTIREVLTALKAPEDGPTQIVDLGCGTGVAGAAWCMHCKGRSKVQGIEMNPDILHEAMFTYREFGINGRGIVCDLNKYRWPKPPVGIIAAFTINELNEKDRAYLWDSLEKQIKGGSYLLILEPLATDITPWWQDWTERIQTMDGRTDEWHFDVELPEQVTLLGKSAGLSPEKLGARTLWIGY